MKDKLQAREDRYLKRESQPPKRKMTYEEMIKYLNKLARIQGVKRRVY
jgi:hypothetical protein